MTRLRRVVVTLEVAPAEYVGAKDTDSGAVNLVIAMLNQEADLPDNVTVSCGNVSRVTRKRRRLVRRVSR